MPVRCDASSRSGVSISPPLSWRIVAIWPPTVSGEQGGLASTMSVDAALEFLRRFRRETGFERYEVEVRQLVAAGSVVMVERVDNLRRSDGSLIAPIPAVGVFEFNAAGKISAWREYFDPASVPAP